MQDRPAYDELLSAVEGFLGDLVTDLEGSRSFHARVAANVVALVRRELEHEDQVLSTEWAGLDDLLGPEEMPATRAALRDAISARNQTLCDRIRSGALDDGEESARTFNHVRTTVHDKLIVGDPALLQR
jgi:hypothetical protein